MKVLGNYEFPETEEESKDWKPFYTYRALHSQVLVVAKTRIEGKWAAYCAPVPGIDHQEEMKEVFRSGSKVFEDYAKAMFPRFAGIPYAK